MSITRACPIVGRCADPCPTAPTCEAVAERNRTAHQRALEEAAGLHVPPGLREYRLNVIPEVHQ